MRYKYLLALASAPWLLMNAACKKGCDGDRADKCDAVDCTMEYRAITVTVNNGNGQGVLIDSTATIGQYGQKIANIDLGFGISGVYTVVDDHYHANLKNKTEAVKFFAFRNGAVVAQADFVVSGDCCHVSKVSGPETISVQ